MGKMSTIEDMMQMAFYTLLHTKSDGIQTP